MENQKKNTEEELEKKKIMERVAQGSAKTVQKTESQMATIRLRIVEKKETMKVAFDISKS